MARKAMRRKGKKYQPPIPLAEAKKIIKEVKKLCLMNQSEINKFLSDIDDIIEHNYKVLMEQHSNIDRTFKELEAITNE